MSAAQSTCDPRLEQPSHRLVGVQDSTPCTSERLSDSHRSRIIPITPPHVGAAKGGHGGTLQRLQVTLDAVLPGVVVVVVVVVRGGATNQPPGPKPPAQEAKG